ncbi:MAG TPA: hypothetical protein VJK05_00010 [archaeon]|nr:hypothetical protein [archaeon]
MKQDNIVLVLAFALIVLFGFNSYSIMNLGGQLKNNENKLNALAVLPSVNAGQASLQNSGNSGNALAEQELIAQLIPKGVPEVYGEALGVSFDDAVNSMNVLAALDGDLYDTGALKLKDLSAEQKKRYTEIGSMIACEYCCGATSLVFASGEPACGCAHSAAMRGLAKYLLINSDLSNEQILEELTKWKIMFFPKQMIEKALSLQASGSGVDSSSLNQLPDMVGGC